MRNVTLRQRLRYRFDRVMVRGGSLLSVSLVVFIALLVALSAPFCPVVGICAGLSCVVVLSLLVAFLTTALVEYMRNQRKGASPIVETGHTLILGWNDRVVEILRELVMANESEPDPCVVILAERDKEWMDDYLALNLPDADHTRVVTRSGGASTLVNLDMVSVHSCKSVIMLAHCSDAASPEAKTASDTRVLKTLLGVVASTDPEASPPTMVAELFDARSREVATQVAADVVTFDAQEVLAKIMVQTSRSVGLSVVYAELLSFAGCEMYFFRAPWGDITFGRLPFHFPDGVPIGLRTSSGQIVLNPPVDRQLAPDDDILIVAQDDSTIRFMPTAVAIPFDYPLRGGRASLHIERELIIGWNGKIPTILHEYADYVLEGSQIDIVVNGPDLDVRRQVDRLAEQLPKLDIRLHDLDPLVGDNLVGLKPFTYDNVIILSQGGATEDTETTDAQTIVVLLLLRRIFNDQLLDSNICETKLVSEVMDSKNQELVARAGVKDFIISNRFVSSILAQISEEPDIKRVYDDLFSEDGCEIYLKRASLYFDDLPAEVSFADMMAIAQKREEVCIGVKLKLYETDIGRNFGVMLVPEKTSRFTLTPRDSLIVVAEDET